MISLYPVPDRDILCRTKQALGLPQSRLFEQRSLAMQTRLCIFIAALFVCASALIAQTNRGGISGTVSDASGAVVPGANVTITNVGTNETRKLVTSQTGAYAAQ